MKALRSFLLFASLMLIIANNRKVIAYTETENLVYINKILELLNNNKECKIPTYEEVDELQASFNELNALYGDSLTSKLTIDQKLVKETLLDQWESFQKRMAAGVVIRTAKKRAFLGKIEQYQEAKYGSSICTSTMESPGPIPDHIFERNPIVRYIKHLETKDVPEYDANGEPGTKGTLANKVEAIRTPISRVTGRELSMELGDAKDEVDNRKLESDEQNSSYDPLANIPVPPVSTQLEAVIETVADNANTETEFAVQPDTAPQSVIETKPYSQIETNHSQTKLGDDLEQHHKSEDVSPDIENGLNDKPKAESDPGLETSSALNSMDEVKENPEAKHESESDSGDQSKPDVEPAVRNESDTKHEPESELGATSLPSVEQIVEKAPDAESKPGDVSENGSKEGGSPDTDIGSGVVPEGESDVQPHPKIVTNKTDSRSGNNVQSNPDQPEPVLVDDATDFAELSRLARVDVPVEWWEYDLRLGNFNWPDEKQTNTDHIFNDSIKNEWRKFLSEHEQFDEQEEKNSPTSVPVENKSASSVSYEKTPGKLRNRKKEFMRSVARDAELRKAEVEFGWVEDPHQGEEYRFNQHWTNLADNNLCKLSVNRNYLSNSRGVKALKSLVGKDQNAKRRLMY